MSTETIIKPIKDGIEGWGGGTPREGFRDIEGWGGLRINYDAIFAHASATYPTIMARLAE